MISARQTLPLFALAMLGACERYATPQEARGSGTATPIAITSQSIALPAETATLPATAEIVTLNCTACHSAELILTQPRLKPDQWQAELTKMRGAYKATIDEKDDPAIIAALLALQAPAAQK